MTRRLWILPVALLGACAGKAKNDVTVVPPGASVEQIEMDPIKIAAVKGPDGTHLETYDVTELFERAGKALSDKRPADAARDYDQLLKEFPDTRYTKAALYNAGLAYEALKDWQTAVARFTKLASEHADSSDAKDALFQIGACYAELHNWPTSATTFAQILERKDLNADDKIEAMGRRGYAQLQLKDFDTAERTLQSAVYYYNSIASEERLETDFYLGLVRYELGEITHERFLAVQLVLPEKASIEVADKKALRVLNDKAKLLLAAQRQYIETIKLGNPQWASAAGYQIGSLYEELYDAFVHAPVPDELQGDAAHEKRDVYYEELRKEIRILLEKSIRTHEQNLLMLERLGVQNEWRDKSKLAFAKLQKMLDPSYKFEFADPATAGSATPVPPPPPAPAPPTGRGGTPEQGPSVRDPKDQAPPVTGPARQIL
jgi:outer membrane protein assembly factor BamD (BamD/ComL family)